MKNALILVIFCVGCGLHTVPPKSPLEAPVEESCTSCVKKLPTTPEEAEKLLAPFNPDGWCGSSVSTKACMMLSDFYAPRKDPPIECWRWDESENVLRCCVWEQQQSKIDEDPVGSSEYRTVTWCTLPDDPCRKWEKGPEEDGC